MRRLIEALLAVLFRPPVGIEVQPRASRRRAEKSEIPDELVQAATTAAPKLTDLPWSEWLRRSAEQQARTMR